MLIHIVAIFRVGCLAPGPSNFIPHIRSISSSQNDLKCFLETLPGSPRPCLLLSTWRCSVLSAGEDILSSMNFGEKKHKCLPNWLIQPTFEMPKKERIGAAVIEYLGAIVMQPQPLTGTTAWGCARIYADSSAHIAHHDVWLQLKSRACVYRV